MLVGIQSAYDDDVKDLEFETGGRGGDSRVVVQIFCRYGREGSLCVVTRMNNQPLHIYSQETKKSDSQSIQAEFVRRKL